MVLIFCTTESINIYSKIQSEDLNIKAWKAFNYLNKTYSLDHLESFEWNFIQPGKNDKPVRHFKFIIEFGLHCFTRGPNLHRGELLSDVETGLHYSDSRETRIFCFERYNLSFHLPRITKSVSTFPCYHTGKGNFFVIEFIDIHGEKKDYEVYFQVSREKRGLLKLFVQSAYIREPGYKSSQPKKKKIGFFVIANNIQQNKAIKIHIK